MQGQKIMAYIWCEIDLVKELKANMPVSTDLMTQERFVPDFHKKIAYIGSCFGLLNLDIKIFHVTIQRPVYAITRAIKLTHTTQVDQMHQLDILHSRDIFFSPIMYTLCF